MKFAERLIACEATGKTAPKATASAAFPIPEKLRQHLAMLTGKGGFRALLSRALVLASQEVSWLRALRVEEEGALGGLEDLPSPPAPGELFEARVVLLAHLLGLLVAFIGENLTLRLMREVWPEGSLDDLHLAAGKDL
jgi:hypothetical protein